MRSSLTLEILPQVYRVVSHMGWSKMSLLCQILALVALSESPRKVCCLQLGGRFSA